MLTSLFGELGLSKRRRDEEAWQDTASGEESGFAATTLLESTDTAVNEQGQLVDRHVRDLLISGSPARGMRRHFARRTEGDGTSHAITLYDPMKVWAPALIKALSDASGQPIERLHLRAQPTMKTLAMIERTRVVRRFDDTLKIYHADVRELEQGTAEIPIVLLERSQLGAVIVGPMHSDAVEHMLQQLLASTQLSTWRCPRLLFMLPPSDVWMADYISELDWPSGLAVEVVHDSLSSTSAVWNALLDAWNRSKASPPWSQSPASPDDPTFPIRVAELAAEGATGSASLPGLTASSPGTSADTPAAAGSPSAGDRSFNLPTAGRELGSPPATVADLLASRSVGTAIEARQADDALRELLANSGVLGCGVVDPHGLPLAMRKRETLDDDMADAASACSQLLRAQRLASRGLGLHDPVDETILSAGTRQQVLRPFARHPGMFLFALIDRSETNLALVRYRMREIERTLG